MTSELIDRLEKAEGPKRDLDEAIFIYLGKAPEVGGDYGWKRTGAGYWSQPIDSEGRQHKTIIAPNYTSSVDAALTLVPEGRDITMQIYNEADGLSADAWVAGTARQHHKSLVIALCIAALKARAQEKE
jgi:hypothetical protein